MLVAQSTTPLWIAARSLLQARRDELFRCWRQVLRGFDPEDIHDLRVASRRVREALALFGPCFPKKSVTKLRKQIKELTGLLGIMRNTDEAIAFFTSVSAGDCAAAVAELLAGLNDEREGELRSLHQGLKSLAPAEVRDAFVRLCDRPLLFEPTQADPFRFLADYGHERLAERGDAMLLLVAPATDESQVAAQHRLRIAVKRFRYRLELLAPLYGERFTALHAVAKNYQELLGRLHDLDVFSEMVTTRVREPAAAKVLCRLLADRRRQRFGEFRELLAASPLAELADRAQRELR